MIDREAAKEPGPPSRRLTLAGRLVARDRGRIELELVDGLTVDMAEEDCTHVDERIDRNSLRALVVVELRGDRPVSIVIQPHLYRVLAHAGAVPFVFATAAGIPPDSFALGLALRDAGPGGGGSGGATHSTVVSTTTWIGTVQQDGTKPDDPREPDTIDIP